MNKKLLLLITFFSFFMFSVSAAEEVTANLSGMNVSLAISGAGANSDITIAVYAPNASLPTGLVVQLADIKADFSGNASFSFTLPLISPTGTYSVKASSGKIAFETTFSFVSTLLVDGINSASSSDDIKRLIDDFGDTADLNMIDYNTLPTSEQMKIINAVTAEKGSGQITEASLKTTFNKALAYACISASNSNESGELSIIEVLKKHGGIFGIDLNNSDYNLLSAEAKAEFRALFSNKDYGTEQLLKNGFSESAIIAYFKKSSWPGIQNYTALASASLLSLDLGSKYQALDDKSIPFKAIITAKDTIKAVSDINTIFNNAVNSAYSSPQGGGTSTGAGGGGSSFNMGNEYLDTGRPVPIQSSEEVIFRDLYEAEWAIPYIERLYELEIINGVGDNRFSPNSPVTREQFLKMIMLAFDYQIEDGDTGFSDVLPDSWYAPYVNTAFKTGIINGMSDTEFGVGLEISRQDMVVILKRALEDNGTVLEKSETEEYNDDFQIADYAKDAVYIMTSYEIINGMGDGLFAPMENATRAAASKVVSLSMDIME